MVSGIILKKAIKRLDITQQKAPEMLGVSRQTVVTWRSRSELDNSICQIVKTKLGVDLYELASEDPQIVPSTNKSNEKENYADKLIMRLELEIENRDKQIAQINSDKDKIIKWTEEAMFL